MKFLRFFGNEFLLGTLIALLSVFTAVASYQGAMADSKQNEFEISGMKNLNDGNAEYLHANQFIVYDYTMYDGWYTAETADKEDYYQASYSQALVDTIAADPENPFSDAIMMSCIQIAILIGMKLISPLKPPEPMTIAAMVCNWSC